MLASERMDWGEFRRILELTKDERDRALVSAVRMEADRDAALALAVKVGTSVCGLSEPEAIARLGRSLRTWTDPEARAEAARIAAAVRAGAIEAREG